MEALERGDGLGPKYESQEAHAGLTLFHTDSTPYSVRRRAPLLLTALS